MVLDTLIFFLLTVLSLSSFIGYGKLISKYYFVKSIKEDNIFNNFFLSLIFIIPISLFYYLFFGNNGIFNLIFITLGFIFFLKEFENKYLKINFLITFIFFSGLLISKTHEDFTTYHYQHIAEISDSTIKFGLANLDERYFYASIFSYVQSLFKFKNLNFIHIPIYLFYLSFIGYLILEVTKGRNAYIMTIILILIIVKFKRLSEFGYDYIGQFTLLYLFLEFILKNKLNLLIENTKLVLIYTSTLLIKISNIYFAPIIFAYFLSQRNIKSIVNYKLLIIPLTLIFLTLTANSFLKTGCFNYLLKETCIDEKKYSWTFNYQNVEATKKLTKNWTRGFYHQGEDKLSEVEYNDNFNWIKNWFYSHFVNKISPFILLIIFIAATLELLFLKKINNFKINYYIIIGIFLSLIFWLVYFPQFRFGFATIAILTICIIKFFRRYDSNFKKKGLIILVVLSIIYFNAYNILRIYNEHNRKDIYIFNNFPFFSQPKLNYKVEKNNSFKFERSSNNSNFWRSCFNANLICVNHDHEVLFEKSGRFIFISKH